MVVALLVVLVGCPSAGEDGSPSPSPHDVSVTVTNDHDARYVVTVRAIPDGVDGLVVTYENGSARRFDVRSLDALPRSALRNASDVAAAGSTTPSEEVVVGPDEGVETTLTGVPANASVVYVVRSRDGSPVLRGSGVVRCSPGSDTTELALAIRSDGSLHVGVVCGAGARP